MQRKPANRLGLRGAQEVKEHAWLKYYPWKDLYDQKLEPPFNPKTGDNFDAKYCNAADKIGNDTKEKYDYYLRDESNKDIFNNYTFHNNDIIEDNRSKVNCFKNPHTSLNSTKLSDLDSGVSKEQNNGLSLDDRIRALEKSPSQNMENKFLKMKKQSNSSSTSALLRQYRQSNNSQNYPNGSVNYLHRRVGSSTSNMNNI